MSSRARTAAVISLSARWWTISRADHLPGAGRPSSSSWLAPTSASATTRYPSLYWSSSFLRSSGLMTNSPTHQLTNSPTSAPCLCDTRRRRFLLGRRFEMMRDQMRPQPLECVGRRVDVLQQFEVLVGDRTPLRHRPEVEHLVPVLAAIENDADLLRQLVGLHQREDFEQLVACAEAARKDHQRLRQ